LEFSCSEGEHNTYEIYLSTEDNSFAKVDFDDELELLLRDFNCEERLIIKMRLAGFTLIEIGKVIGVCGSRVSQVMTNMGKRLLADIISSGIAYNEKTIKELCMKGIK
jgi:DNA-directed RNA polymerase specialized sigma subunit